MKRQKKQDKAAKKRESAELARSTEPEQRNGHPARTLGVPVGAAAAVAGRHLDASSAANALQHQPTNGLVNEATNALTHHASEAVGTEVTAAAAGAGIAAVAGAGGAAAAGAGTAAGLGAGAAAGAGTTAAAGAGAAAGTAVAAGAGSGAAAGGAAGGAAAAGQGAQTAAIGAIGVAAVATVVVVVATTGDEPEVAEPAPTTTTTEAPAPIFETPNPGPGIFETAATGPLDGDLLAGVDQNTEAGALMVAGLLGSPTNVGVPVTLESGATLTVDPQGGFEYLPSESFINLPPGESIVEEFTYVVTNAGGFTEEWTATVTVLGENDEPMIEDVAAVSVVEEATTSRDLVATDPDGDIPTFALAEGTPSFVSLVDAGDGTAALTIAPTDGTAGTYEVVINATDTAEPALTGSTTVTVTVAAKPEEVARVSESLVALYDFNEGSGATAGDSSGAGGVPALTVADPASVTWGGSSLTIDQPTIIRSADSASGLVEAIKGSNEFTVEAWVTPANATQGGPARIVSMSEGTGSRNVTLSQGDTDGVNGDQWTARQRSTGTSTNGLPTLSTNAGTAAEDRLTHLALTRTAAGEVLFYVDGAVAGSGTAGGDLSNWDGSLPLMLGNETTMDRPWIGSFHLVAVYARALSEAEIAQNVGVGA